jgi:hypothetical protein
VEELITSLTRLQEIESELAQIKETRKDLAANESRLRKERASVVAALRAGGLTIARPRKAGKEKKSKKPAA